MTEQQITETDVEETEETDQPAEDVVEGTEPEQTEEKGKGNSEAAKWRVRFREAEAEVEALKSRVADMQAAEVSRLATGPGRLHDGQDLLLAAKLTDLLDEDGAVNEEAVTEAVQALTERKPHLARPAYDSGVGIGEKGTPSGATWADVIAG